MTPGRWTFTCTGDIGVAGCFHHEHHHDAAAADIAARLHQAEHAVRNGSPQREVPGPKATDLEWGIYIRQWRAPVVSMDTGSLRPGCVQCAERAGFKPLPKPREVPKPGPDFY